MSATSLPQRVHRELARYANPDGHVLAGAEDLADLTGASSRGVRLALARLVDDGLVVLVRPGIPRRPAEYRVSPGPVQ